MAYTPKPIEQSIYTTETGDKLFKVISANPIEVVVVRLNKDNSEESAPLTWSEKQWNGKRLRSIEEPPPPPHEDKSFTFQYDKDGNLTIFQDGKPVKRLNIRGPEGKPGKDGMPGQDGAPGQKGQDGATGQPGKDGAPGEKGQDGAPGKDGAPGPEGKQGAPGPKGEDGVYWYPEISKDGTQLRFKNRNNSSEHTEWYDIKGPKGDTGGEGPRGIVGPAGPVFIPSVNSDGELSWSNTGQGLTNPSTRNIKGDKGDKGDKGATFHPIVKDGVLYWYDDNGNLVKGITPARITGAQGKQGEQGVQGLSAYQIWLKQGYRGTEQDFLDSLKGEKGAPAPPASFSYKDVKDFKCDVQEIDTNLIVDSDEPTDSPEKIIEDRTNEIQILRAKGHEKENLVKYRVGWFKKFTWWCAGADRDLLTMCPSDHSKYVGIGTTILFTALMAVFSSFFAMRLVFGVDDTNLFDDWGNLGAFVVALVWGLMIFFLDRFITNTMYSDGKVSISKQEFISGLPRMLIAIFIGIVIAAPLELKIFEQEVSNQIKESRESYLKAKCLNETNKIDSLMNDYRDSIKLCIDNLELVRKNNEEIKELTNNINSNKVNSKTNFARRKRENESQEQYDKYLADLDKQNLANSQIAAKETERNTSNDIGRKNKLQDDNKRLKTDTTHYFNEIVRLGSEKGQIKNEYDPFLSKTSLDTFAKDAGLFAHLEALHTIATKDYTPWWTSEENSSNGNFWDTILHSWWWYLFNSAIGLIMLLFILIDISPVLYKMMLADGNYDNYLHQEKLLAQDKIRLSLSNMLKKLDDSELKRVAPFIMGDIYEKMAGDSYVYKTEAEFKKELARYKGKNCWLWRIWPFSMLRWMFWKEEERPSAPVIILNERKLSVSQQTNLSNLDAANTEVFNEVLEMKKKIILASYRRWYKTQHDCIICDDINDENKAREPFEDEAPLGDDSDIHIDDNEESGNWGNASEGDNDFMDENIDEGASKANNDNSEEANTEDSEPNPEDENVSEVLDDDEQELADDDGDDNPKK
jgi:hypothetical protein